VTEKNETPEIGQAVAEHLRRRAVFHRAEEQFLRKPSEETRKRFKRAERACDDSRKALKAEGELQEAIDRADAAIRAAFNGAQAG
jgi:hypothetical protein